jgi:hypothetical protein
VRARYITLQPALSHRINAMAATLLHSGIAPHRALSNGRDFPTRVGACRHGVVVLIAKIPSAFPLLDTPKVLHIWYTTTTRHGWFMFEFNYSGLVIRQMETGLNLCAARFRRSITLNSALLPAPTGELKND